MCSIIIADNIKRLRELIELNEHRGTHSHSFSLYGPNEYGNYDLVHMKRSLGPINKDDLFIPVDYYAIVHQQAPTTDNKDESAIHPAQLGEHYLWHNGIIKEKEIKRLQEELGSTFTWDTKLILRKYIETEDLNNIDGSFACVYAHRGKLEIFRNEISPLFTTEEFECFSSTKFEGSIAITPNVVYSLDYNARDRCFEAWESTEFSTVENPYFFGD